MSAGIHKREWTMKLLAGSKEQEDDAHHRHGLRDSAPGVGIVVVDILLVDGQATCNGFGGCRREWGREQELMLGLGVDDDG